MTLECNALIRKPGMLFIEWDVWLFRDDFEAVVVEEGLGEGGELCDVYSSNDWNPKFEIFSSYSMSIIGTLLFEWFSFDFPSKGLWYEGFSYSRSKKWSIDSKSTKYEF